MNLEIAEIISFIYKKVWLFAHASTQRPDLSGKGGVYNWKGTSC